MPTNYHCPNCGKKLEVVIPSKPQVSEKGFWDSLVRCTQCDEVHFKEIWPDGLLQIRVLLKK